MGLGAGSAALIGGALSAAGGIGSAVLSGGAQKSAANTAANTQLSMYNQTRNDLQPYAQAGQNAFSALSNLMGQGGTAASQNMLAGLQQYPGYQFAMDQGVQALDRSAASKGLLLSGGQLKDITAYGQGLATQNFNNYFNQQYQLASLGENAAAQTGQLGASAASQAGGYQQAAGNATANTYTNAFNSLTGANGLVPQLLSSIQSGTTPANTSAETSAGTWLSDRRAKDDILPIGKLDSGLPVYSYRYKGSMLPQIGVMAQDVEKVAPHAVHTDPASGLKRVDYAAVARLPRARSYLPEMRKAA
jgi:hypothetical protein